MEKVLVNIGDITYVKSIQKISEVETRDLPDI